MSIRRKAAVAVAAVAVLLAGVAVAGPALAGNGPGPGGDGWPAGTGQMEQHRVAGHQGYGPGDGSCWVAPGDPVGELTGDQAQTLATITEQHKLAHDLYAAFADQYQDRVFDRVTTAEARQLAAMRTLLERYGVTDPTAGLADGMFADPTVQASYDRLLDDGSAGSVAALTVGQTLEGEQIAALEAALDEVPTPDVVVVYEHLLAASQHHLARFDG